MGDQSSKRVALMKGGRGWAGRGDKGSDLLTWHWWGVTGDGRGF